MSLIPLPYRLIAIALAVAALSAGLWGFIHHERTLGKAEAEAAQTQQALTASIANQAVSAQRVTDVQEKAHAADLAASAARADADAARDADQRLRVRLAAAERRRTASDPAASAAGPAAAAPELVPYDVFVRVDDAAGELGTYADQLRVSLDACIGSYQSLK